MLPSPTIDHSINLIKERKPHFLDQFINWALTIGRGLVIITQAIALSAFLYRFDLDARISDLNDAIKYQQNIINAYKQEGLEDTYRNLQNRLLLANAIIKTQHQTLKLYKDINGLIPTGMSIKSFIFFPDRLKIDLTVPSVEILSEFTKNLQEYSATTKVSLDSIENKPGSGLILASITASFKTQTYKPL